MFSFNMESNYIPEKNGNISGDKQSVSLTNTAVHLAAAWWRATRVMTFLDIYRWHNVDSSIRIIRWKHWGGKCPPLNWKIGCSIHGHLMKCRSAPWVRAFTAPPGKKHNSGFGLPPIAVIKIVKKWKHWTRSNFSTWQQWFGANASPSLHSRSKGELGFLKASHCITSKDDTGFASRLRETFCRGKAVHERENHTAQSQYWSQT